MPKLGDWKYVDVFISSDQMTFGQKYFNPDYHRSIFIGRNLKLKLPERYFVRVEPSDFSMKPLLQKHFGTEKEAHQFAYNYMKKLK